MEVMSKALGELAEALPAPRFLPGTPVVLFLLDRVTLLWLLTLASVLLEIATCFFLLVLSDSLEWARFNVGATVGPVAVVLVLGSEAGTEVEVEVDVEVSLVLLVLAPALVFLHLSF